MLQCTVQSVFKHLVPQAAGEMHNHHKKGLISKLKINRKHRSKILKIAGWLSYICLMTNFIPIFPLGIVAYPGEQLNLHIFEPGYKQLIKECTEKNKPFGLPPIINNRIGEMGTVMQVLEISKVYDDGKMDIKTLGISIFKILETVGQVPEKLYSGAIVNYPLLTTQGSASLMKKILSKIRQMHRVINIHKDFQKPDEELCSYDVAHHAGLNMEDEYHLLELEHELHRQEFLKRHLEKMQPVITEMNTLKGRVKMNGHFKNLGSNK